MRTNTGFETPGGQLFGFVMAGGLATASHWIVMAILISLHVLPLTATAVGSLMGAVANYILQRRLAFRNAGAHGPAVIRYLFSCLLAWLSNIALFVLLSDLLAMPVVFAQVLTTLIVALLNFIVYQRLVFV